MIHAQAITTGLAACIFILSNATVTRADLILEVSSVSWDRQGPAPQLVFSISADANASNGANSNNINSFNLIFSIRPESGATGTVTIFNEAQASDSVFASFSDLRLNPDIGGGFASIQGQNSITPPNLQPSNVTVSPGTRRNLVSLSLAPSADAAGDFAVYVSNTSNFTFVNEFDGVAYANLPFSNPPTDVRLGVVAVAAVPEPATGLLWSGICLACLRRHRGTRSRSPTLQS